MKKKEKKKRTRKAIWSMVRIPTNTSKKKTKYLRQAFYFINDLICENSINVKWTSTHNQLANVLTKRLGPNKISTTLHQLGVGK